MATEELIAAMTKAIGDAANEMHPDRFDALARAWEFAAEHLNSICHPDMKDAEQCSACIALEDVCPYHLGIVDGFEHARNVAEHAWDRVGDQ